MTIYYHCILLIAKITRQVSELTLPSCSGNLPSYLRNYSGWVEMCRRRANMETGRSLRKWMDHLGVKYSSCSRRDGQEGNGKKFVRGDTAGPYNSPPHLLYIYGKWSHCSEVMVFFLSLSYSSWIILTIYIFSLLFNLMVPSPILVYSWAFELGLPF